MLRRRAKQNRSRLLRTVGHRKASMRVRMLTLGRAHVSVAHGRAAGRADCADVFGRVHRRARV
eukprot:2562493-Pleurochrysis_carterae.AAC.1